MFYSDKDNAICIVTEYLPESLLTPPLKKSKPSESDEETKEDSAKSLSIVQCRDLFR